jgi:excisionase family DNA binding protein
MAWLTVQEAAELLRVPVSWLYERTRTNTVPHVKLGKYLRFDRDELNAWLEALKRDGRAASPATARSARPAIVGPRHRTEQR